MIFSIAIDGPSGAGKSTIARQVAKNLSIIYIDTGAMYRAMGLYFLRNQISSADKERMSEACKNVNITIRFENGEQQVMLNEEPVNDYIRTEEVGMMASAVAVNMEVRLKLVELQRKLAASDSVVMDGRDIGSYVLPNADIKIYLTADAKVRAKRRWLELEARGTAADLDSIERDIIERDKQDMNREFAPLCQAEDAILLDSSHMNIEEVVDKIMEIYKNRI